MVRLLLYVWPLPVTLVDGEMVSWYGTRAISGLCYLAALRRDLAEALSA